MTREAMHQDQSCTAQAGESATVVYLATYYAIGMQYTSIEPRACFTGALLATVMDQATDTSLAYVPDVSLFLYTSCRLSFVPCR
jgi:hypothetical protein